MLLTRRKLIAGCAGGAIALATSPGASQQAYPARTITLVVPYAAGGTTDLLGRLVADQFKTGMGATCRCREQAGCRHDLRGQPGRESPAGRLYAVDGDLHDCSPSTRRCYRKLPYDPLTDFTPIALVAAVPFALVVNPSLPVSSLSEFIAYAKSKPGELAYGSAGIGSPQHLGAEMLKTAAALDIRHVPYRGSVAAMLDVVAGHIPLMVVDLQPALPQIREGKLRALGVTTAVRVGSAPDITDARRGRSCGFRTGGLAGRGIACRRTAAHHRSACRRNRKAPIRSRDTFASSTTGPRAADRLNAGRLCGLCSKRD
jgi:tripartite-type tricarboxylate transporter receptor subunit TctC